MSDSYSILAVDDQPLNQKLINIALKGQYRMLFADNGEECLEKVSQVKPDLVLLDIKMPGMDGYETCRRLKAEAGTEQVPVIFVTGLDTLEERMAGYDAGGEDFLTKPFQPHELRARVELVLASRAQGNRFSRHAVTDGDTASVFMKSTGEPDALRKFLRASLACKDCEQLADRLLESLHGYGLKGTLQVRARNGQVNRDTRGVPRPMVLSLIEALVKTGPIFDFQNRTVFNAGPVSILVKNMPRDEPACYRRIKDSVSLLVEEAAARVGGIEMASRFEHQQHAMRNALADARQILEQVHESHQLQKKESTRILEELLCRIEGSFPRLGLTEEQEESVLGMLNTAIEDALRHYQRGLEDDSHLEGVVSAIEQLLQH